MESGIQGKTLPFCGFGLEEVQVHFEVILVDFGAVWLYWTLFYAMADVIYSILRYFQRYCMLSYVILVFLILILIPLLFT